MLRTLLILTLLACVPAQAATLKIATLAPDGTSWMQLMRAAGDRIEARTDGRVSLKFYPGGVMGNAETVLRKMRVGQLHGGAFTAGELGGIYPDLLLLGVPFLFRDLDEALAVRADLDEKLRVGIRERGYELLGIAGGSFGYLMSDRSMASRDELVAGKVWVPEGDLVAAMSLELAGVSPIPLPLSDVYTGLQTGLVDTVVNSPVGAIAFQWHTRLTHFTDLPVSYVVGTFLVSNRAFGRLSGDDQTVVREELAETFAAIQAQDIEDNVGARNALASEGLEAVTVAEPDYWESLADRTLDALAEQDRMSFEHLDTLRELLRALRD